ncbi:hypothetical protein CIG11343_1582 [Campylobacter iguaniorum]|uniref:hypothetical protein n=1 Tax=Campylobacter iguaniorum TaxID=1244531 RepID=UPI0007C8F63F|nr:hypothetical protein [Campylobacter iguaniorum]ANE36560.1 hypothetical protein CIG11343_1582 [Campylobacter iguaniorum]
MKSFFTSLGTGIAFLLLFVAGAFFNEFITAQKVFDQNNEMTFSRQFDASSKMMPNLFVAEPKFSAKEALSTQINLDTKTKQEIANSFATITQKAQNSGICTGGSYSIEPNYSYENGKQSLSGQRLDAKLICSFKNDELKIYDELIKEIENIAANSEFIAVSTAVIRPSFAPQSLQSSQENLYDEIIKNAIKYEKHYSEVSQKICKIKDINFFAPSISNLLKHNFAYSSDRVANTALSVAPALKEEDIQLNANVIYSCR